MSTQILVHRGRTVTITVLFGYDISENSFSSDIRVSRNRESQKITDWFITPSVNNPTREIVLTLDDSKTETITEMIGYMDIKMISGGEPLQVFDTPLMVLFLNPVTA